ncbi:STAS domain-containing protein [Geobacter sp. DSM 9736]|uniref:STAS domain-containing protein n=1 Tax=Geobacter sp. DSM 9736 TaxID=1277350 RepID=UPI000B50976D|nr:STAS domain-containing protein [Geobacter sp. DSM 9736]SNB44783.1 STAS domain-containing protein [Geobacter sp. DSM 9736]
MSDFTVTHSMSEDGEVRVVTLSGEMTIMHAGELRETLLSALAGEGKFRVDVTAVTDIDLAGLQLLCAAHRAAVGARGTMTLNREGNEGFVDAARAAGFPRHVGCSRDTEKSCIWVGGY